MSAGEPEIRRTGEPEHAGLPGSPVPRRPGSPCNAWLQLLRVPNFLTVPGDIVAGFLLAHGAAASPGCELAVLAAASLCFYAGGLVLNDLADFEVDAKERPERPLPSGRVSREAAQLVMAVFFAGGLLLCLSVGAGQFQGGLLLAALVVIYNQHAKKSPVAGPVVMGLCRGFNLLLGASLVTVFPVGVWICAAVETLFIARVTSMARQETSGGKITPKVIGALLSLLIPMQAVFCAASGAGKTGWLFAAALVALWPLHRIAARRFYAS